MVNGFHETVSFDGDYEEIFDKFNFIRIFDPIFKSFPDKQEAGRIVKYIAYAFSLESNKITVSGDRRKETQDIFNELKIKKDLYTDVVLLQNNEILKSVQAWCKFQDSAQLEYLFTLKQAYVQQQSAAISPLKKSDGVNIDFDQKQKCIEHMRELKQWIKDAESELQQNNPKLKEAYKDILQGLKKTGSNTMGLETMLKQYQED